MLLSKIVLFNRFCCSSLAANSAHVHLFSHFCTKDQCTANLQKKKNQLVGTGSVVKHIFIRLFC
jgi:hypothetical protein